MTDKYITVAAALIEKDGRYLIAKRRLTDRFGGLWEFPGGKLEPGESPKEALERELREELGLKARAQKLFMETSHDFGNITVKLLVFHAHASNDPVVLSDHEEIAWAAPRDLCRYEFTLPDRPVVERLREANSD